MSQFALTATVLLSLAVGAENSFQEKPWEQLSSRVVSDWGQAAIQNEAAKWKHGETEHFIIHFVRNGEKIARRCEVQYAEIKEFFGNRPDLMPGQKLQVFAFHEAEAWARFRAVAQMPWIAGVTRGTEFFYLTASEEGRFDNKAKVQAHEMTHLIFNRFFKGRPPLWLNEGIAEYFGQRKTTGISDFRRQMGAAPRIGLGELFKVEAYPESKPGVQAFYAEAAIVVDFLTHTSERTALLPKFVEAMVADNDVAKALTIYGYRDLAEFTAAYNRYRKRF